MKKTISMLLALVMLTLSVPAFAAPEDAQKMGVTDKQVVKLQTYTARPLVFDDVVVRVRPDFQTYVHLDYDEANACGFQKGDLGRIIL